MSTYASVTEEVNDTYGNWVYIIPVSGLTLTDSVRNEFRIRQVTFVTKTKLARIRKRLGIPQRISVYERSRRYRFIARILESSDIFAVVRHNGKPKELETRNLRSVTDALSILGLSQLGYMKRRFGANPTVLGNETAGTVQYALLNSGDVGLRSRIGNTGKHKSLVLGGRWMQYHRSVFFLKLVDILNGKYCISHTWRNDLYNASVVAGQSMGSSDLTTSFLWNVIALETLLVKQNQNRVTDELPATIEAFIGWVGFWSRDDYVSRIKEIYGKRNGFVHQGDRNRINVSDLLFTDDLLLNVLMNIVNHIDLFSSKDKVQLFARKVDAERLLGIPPQVRPKSLRFISRTYSDADREKI